MAIDIATELITLLQSTAPIVIRVGAAEGLGELGDPRSHETLIKVMNSGQPQVVRAAAARALGRSARLKSH